MNVKFTSLEIKNFYLSTPLMYLALWLKLDDQPKAVIQQYNLNKKVTEVDFVYTNIKN